ncbi:TPA: DUF1845 family protein [Enterobacter chengduensis]|nr:DUF1845 family protein [Enterobacter chengduensis]
MPGSALHGNICVTLHTRITIALWLAQPTDLPQCLALLRRLERAATSDDPWAAHWLANIQAQLTMLEHLVIRKQRQLDRRFAGLPDTISNQPGHNPFPAQFTLTYAQLTQPGARLIVLLTRLDFVVRDILLAWRLNLISADEKSDTLRLFPRLIRQLYSYVNRFRTTGVTRDDVRRGTPLADSVTRRLGKLPGRLLAEIHHHAE